MIATLSTCAALACELRAMRTHLEALAMVMVSDERFARDYGTHLQSFDFIVQHADECANLLDRVAQGQGIADALERVRLADLQQRLQKRIQGA